MIKLYFAPQSRSFRLLWYLEEMNMPYQLEEMSLKKGDHKTPKFLAINPMGKVPTVEVDGKVIWESPAIINQLADLYPQTRLAPAVGTPERADYYRWMSFSTAVLEPAFVDHMANQHPNPVSVGWGSFDSMKKALATAFVPGPWILGEKFSGADVMIGGNLSWFCRWKKDAFADVPGLLAYVSRIEARPAYQKATAKEAEILVRLGG